MSRRATASTFSNYVQLKETHEKRVAKIMSGYKSDASMHLSDKKTSYRNRRLACAKCDKKSRLGTIFTETAEAYEARCGHEDAPCSLNLRVEKKSRRSLFDVMREAHAGYRLANTRLLALQMDSTFELGAESEILNTYGTLKEEMDRYVKAYRECVEQYNGYVHRMHTAEREADISEEMERGLADIDALLRRREGEGSLGSSSAPSSSSGTAKSTSSSSSSSSGGSGGSGTLSQQPTDGDIKEVVSIYRTNVYRNAALLRSIQKPLRRVDVSTDSKKNITHVEYQHVGFRPEDIERAAIGRA